MIRKILSTTLLSLGMVLSAGVPARAALGCDVAVTGPFSDTHCEVREAIRNSIAIQNHQMIDSHLAVGANTGDNHADFNTISGGVHTGSIQATLLANTHLADTTVLVNSSPIHEGHHAALSFTGPFSDNSVEVTSTRSTNVDVSNTAHVNNTIHVAANTGGNSAGFNTISDGIHTGNAGVAVESSVDTGETVVVVD